LNINGVISFVKRGIILRVILSLDQDYCQSGGAGNDHLGIVSAWPSIRR